MLGLVRKSPEPISKSSERDEIAENLNRLFHGTPPKDAAKDTAIRRRKRSADEEAVGPATDSKKKKSTGDEDVIVLDEEQPTNITKVERNEPVIIDGESIEASESTSSAVFESETVADTTASYGDETLNDTVENITKQPETSDAGEATSVADAISLRTIEEEDANSATVPGNLKAEPTNLDDTGKCTDTVTTAGTENGDEDMQVDEATDRGLENRGDKMIDETVSAEPGDEPSKDPETETLEVEEATDIENQVAKGIEETMSPVLEEGSNKDAESGEAMEVENAVAENLVDDQLSSKNDEKMKLPDFIDESEPISDVPKSAETAVPGTADDTTHELVNNDNTESSIVDNSTEELAPTVSSEKKADSKSLPDDLLLDDANEKTSEDTVEETPSELADEHVDASADTTNKCVETTGCTESLDDNSGAIDSTEGSEKIIDETTEVTDNVQSPSSLDDDGKDVGGDIRETLDTLPPNALGVDSMEDSVTENMRGEESETLKEIEDSPNRLLGTVLDSENHAGDTTEVEENESRDQIEATGAEETQETTTDSTAGENIATEVEASSSNVVCETNADNIDKQSVAPNEMDNFKDNEAKLKDSDVQDSCKVTAELSASEVSAECSGDPEMDGTVDETNSQVADEEPMETDPYVEENTVESAVEAEESERSKSAMDEPMGGVDADELIESSEDLKKDQASESEPIESSDVLKNDDVETKGDSFAEEMSTEISEVDHTTAKDNDNSEAIDDRNLGAEDLEELISETIEPGLELSTPAKDVGEQLIEEDNRGDELESKSLDNSKDVEPVVNEISEEDAVIKSADNETLDNAVDEISNSGETDTSNPIPDIPEPERLVSSKNSEEIFKDSVEGDESAVARQASDDVDADVAKEAANNVDNTEQVLLGSSQVDGGSLMEELDAMLDVPVPNAIADQQNEEGIKPSEAKS